MLFHQMLPWVSMAPLGRPVVPEVYMITATSSASIGSRVGERRGVAGDGGERRPSPSAAASADDVVAARELVADAVDDRAVGARRPRSCGRRRR